MTEREEPGARYWAMVEPVWLSLNANWEDCDKFLSQFGAVPSGVGHLYAAHWCQSEVCNGGLLQFFSNTTGLLAPEALEGFRAIGIGEWAVVLSEAMRFFGDKYPRERLARQELLPGHAWDRRGELDPFSRLDERFFKWVNAAPNRWEHAADAYAEQSQRRTSASS